MRVRLKHRTLALLPARKPITQNRWAQMLGFGRGHLSDLVNGRHVYPTPRTRRKLLEVLSLDRVCVTQYPASSSPFDAVLIPLFVHGRYWLQTL